MEGVRPRGVAPSMDQRLPLLLLAAAVGACAETSSSDDDAYPFPTGDGKADSIQLAALPVTMSTPTAGTFDQQIDHDSALGTFKQRFWWVTDFAKGPDSP